MQTCCPERTFVEPQKTREFRQTPTGQAQEDPEAGLLFAVEAILCHTGCVCVTAKYA